MEYINAKTILSGYGNGDWFGCNYNMNLYKGCCHGCIYCDSRSECYQIENFDTVKAKKNALLILQKELKAKRKTGVVGSGAMSDPYNPFEERALLTRGSLSLLNNYGFGSSIITKSDLVIRDIDLYKSILSHSPVLIKITITTPHDELSRKVEPFAPETSKRLAALRKLSENGIFCGSLLMPCLPFIEDNEEDIILLLKKVAETGAKFVYADFGVTLRANQRQYYYQQLDRLFPNLKERYIKAFGDRYECGSPDYYKLKTLFEKECRKLGLLYKMTDIINGYKSSFENNQLTFF